MIYSDEFEVCNPIGVSKNKQKMFAVYFKVMNFHPRHTSNLNTIHLLLLAKSSTIKNVGVLEILNPLMTELNDLYFVGIKIDDVNFYAIANCFCGDNLASNFIGVFSCNFALGKFCRHCTVSTPEVYSSLTSVSSFPLRTHDSILRDSLENKEGMKFVCPFVELPYVRLPLFFPPDVMHDVLEGITHLVFCVATFG